MDRIAVDRPDTRLAQRLASVQRRAGTVRDRPANPHDELDCLVVTAAGRGPDLDGTGRGGIDVEPATALLRSGRAATVVVVSSALVYGAWADNPVPLTEDAPLRPRPESSAAAAYAELERVAAGLRSPEVTVAILRPSMCVDPGVARSRRRSASRWMERSLWQARVSEGEDRPSQFLHIDDLARAMEHARLNRLDGAFNVAPPGWLSARQQLDLVGSAVEVRMPGRLRRTLAALRRRAQLGPDQSELAAYADHPWVISSDRLRATGWVASYTNEEAFVLGHRPGWWSTLNPDQRQVVSLGFLGGAAVGVLWAVAGLARRASRGAGVGRCRRGGRTG
jgi:nucleoside-diphosphate-sugar epimerase